MMDLPYIEIKNSGSNQIVLEIEDTEVFDFIEDYLIEQCDIHYDRLEVSKQKGISIYRLSFLEKFTREELESHLAKLDPFEIEMIYRINNR